MIRVFKLVSFHLLLLLFLVSPSYCSCCRRRTRTSLTKPFRNDGECPSNCRISYFGYQVRMAYHERELQVRSVQFKRTSSHFLYASHYCRTKNLHWQWLLLLLLLSSYRHPSFVVGSLRMETTITRMRNYYYYDHHHLYT